jgi:hypothetical protein
MKTNKVGQGLGVGWDKLAQAIAGPPGVRPTLGRREFLAGCLRSAAVGGVTGAAALLVMRTARLPAAECRRRTVCLGCPEWGGCALPPAVAARAAGRGNQERAS